MVRPRKFDENEVIEGAMAMFQQRGYNGTSIPELTANLGICRQSLYATFGGKRGLYFRALEAWARREVDTKLELLGAEGSPLENLRTVVRGLAALAAACPDAGSLAVTALVESRWDPEVLAAVEDQVARMEQGFAETLKRAQDRGEILADVRPARLARALTTAAYGMGLLTRLPGSGGRIADMVSVLLELLDNPPADVRVAEIRPAAPARHFEPGI